ncbi:LapA family protein [Citromicrobium bathyomarinum]|uniref:LapA family protein n=1 Tax=Citromicrobium bathyomarinum TaxID=72174 RepID=UPI00315A94D0
MQVIRTIIWVLILFGVLLFSFFNWNPVEVTIWDNLVLETKVPALVIISFLLGFLPTWLISRGIIWSLNRKIRSLEIAAKASSVSAAAREAEREEASRQEPVADEAVSEDAEAAAANDTPEVETPAEPEPLLTTHDTPAEDSTIEPDTAASDTDHTTDAKAVSAADGEPATGGEDTTEDHAEPEDKSTQP